MQPVATESEDREIHLEEMEDLHIQDLLHDTLGERSSKEQWVIETEFVF